MSKFIDADKLIAEIKKLKERSQAERVLHPKTILSAKNYLLIKDYDNLLSTITSLQQEQSETDMKSPFTGGKVTILSRQEEATFRGEKVKITRKYYRCEDTGREFTNDKLDDDMMWAAFRVYCEKKGVTSFTDIMLKQEQPDKYETALEKAREWMSNVNQGGHAILIDIFPELGEGLDPRYGGRKQKQPEVDLDNEVHRFFEDCIVVHEVPLYGKVKEGVISVDCYEITARHFYELGLNAKKEK